MVNIDDRILSEVNENQLFLLVAIAKHIGANSSAWPSNKKLCEATRWSDNKLQRVKAEMIKDGLIKVEPRFHNNSQTSNVYTICTKRIGVMVNLSDIQPLPQNVGGGVPQNVGGPLPQNGGTEVLTNEVLTNKQQQQLAAAADFDTFSIEIIEPSKRETIEVEKGKKAPPIAPAPPSPALAQPSATGPFRYQPFDFATEIEAIRGDFKMRENLTIISRVPQPFFEAYLDAFKAQEEATGSNHSNARELRRHFLNFSRRRYESESKKSNKNQTADERFIANLNRTIASIDIEQFR